MRLNIDIIQFQYLLAPWEFSDYQNWEARIKTIRFLNEHSCRSWKFLIDTSLEEAEPVVTETYEFAYRDLSELLRFSFLDLSGF